MSLRIGFGFDTHRLEEGRKLYVGGICIPHHKGAMGHSDADTLIHAICDAFLGAIAAGDIGTHFPDTDPQYKGMDSKVLLKQVITMTHGQSFFPVNLDCTVVIEKPRIMPYIREIRECLSGILEIPVTDISIKAKTSEKLGFIGREEGVSAYAVVLLQKR